ncbi:hypothetical protein BJF93_01475 [Xaviernesmea oryzae]|uniref:diguanylate cyclase n=1 Tax=Xaviernesmea oryzae TaxID=464029 RepID=A0A1Q9B2A0_9HYPH|nr:GGDEF domain-containing protein [Xaviernesmea oryzae]OLP62143.1 hypothetical protein BJF93_01475 [Xaviernesmea oryzae]SEL88944.1 diguanylate cyclase (GGDEF) domain-containing protein [Xaviernesmea oryzae]
MLDSATLFIASIAVDFGLAVYFWSLWIGDRRQPIALWIAASTSSATLGSLCVTLRDIAPNIVTIWAGQLCFINVFVFLWVAVRLVHGRQRPGVMLWAGAAIWTLLCLFPPIFQSENLRSTCVTVIYAAYCLTMCGEMLRGGMRRQRLSRALTAGLLFILAASSLALTIYTAFNQEAFSPVQRSQPLAALWLLLFLVIYIVLIVAVTTLELSNEAERQRQVAATDGLTGLMNRRAFMETAQGHAAAQCDIALLLLDIDHFKRINDRWGHAAGDRALTRFATALSQATDQEVAGDGEQRPLIARLGGEEFVCMLVGPDARKAEKVGERIRAMVERGGYANDGFGMTVSIGVAASFAGACDVDELLLSADRALYRAKDGGRNRVEHEEQGLVVSLDATSRTAKAM